MQQKILLGLVLTLIIVIFIPVYWATESGRQEAARERLKTEAVARGAGLYASHCGSCHGSAGEGRIGPALKDSPLDENVLEKVIARGIPGTAMPASAQEEGGSLKEHQIKDLVTFIKNWDQSLIEAPSATPAALVPVPAPPQTPIPSSINAGELFAVKCAVCHGANREGTPGLAPALTPEILDPLSAAEVREALAEGRPAKGMPPFKGILSAEEIDALVQFMKNVLP